MPGLRRRVKCPRIMRIGVAACNELCSALPGATGLSEPPGDFGRLVFLGLAVAGLENEDVAPSSAWGSVTYAEGQRTGVGIADCPPPMRLTSPLFEARCIRFDNGSFHLSWDSHGAVVGPSPARRVLKPFSLQTGFVRV